MAQLKVKYVPTFENPSASHVFFDPYSHLTGLAEGFALLFAFWKRATRALQHRATEATACKWQMMLT